MNTLTVALITMVAILSVVVWFDRRCLADLAEPAPVRPRRALVLPAGPCR